MFVFDNPVIAAVRSEEEFLLAANSQAEVIFVLKSDILNIKELMKKSGGKKVFVHADMAEGVGKDKKGLEFLRLSGVDGIISTKNHLITLAKELKLATVQRFFIIDSLSVATALEGVKSVKPDFVEIMPGVIPKAVKRFVENAKIPVIAGGLIENKTDVINALSAGASAVSTAKQELWNE